MASNKFVRQKGGYGSCGGPHEEEKTGGKRRRSKGRSRSSRKASPKRSRKRRSVKSSSKKSDKESKKKSSKKKKRKGSKSKLVAKSKCGDNLTNPNFTALCMTCYHRSGKKDKKATMAIPGRECRQTKNGGLMVLGKCAKCGGTMAKIVSKTA